MSDAEAAAWRPGLPALGLLLGGVLLALLPLLADTPWLWPALWLAHPAIALGLGALSGLRAIRRIEPAEAVALAALHAAGYAGFVALLAWPLHRITVAPGAATVMLAGMAAGLGLFVLWRHGMAFVHAVREGGGLRALREAAAFEPPRGPGLALALPLGLAYAAVALLVLAGPGQGIGLRALLVVVHLLAAVAGALVAARLAGLHLPDARRRDAAADAPALQEGLAFPDEAAAVDAAVDADAHADERLLAAVRQGRIEEALAALDEGADPNVLPEPDDRDQRPPAVLACLHSDLSLLRALIARGADLNAMHAGLTPLLAATRDSWHGRVEAVMTLLTNGADPRQADAEGQTPLHHAARSSDAAVAALLLDAEAGLEALDAEGFSPLGSACAAGNWRLARFLVERGASPQPEGGQPALLAAVAGDDDPAGVQLLLKHKARVDAGNSSGRTALMMACKAGHAEIVQVLLDAGADRNATDEEGQSPLLLAAAQGHIDVIRRLVHPRLDASVRDAQGRTPLLLACAAAATTPELLSLLLDLGVDRERADESGRTALDVAVEAGRWPLVQVLQPDYPMPSSVAEALQPQRPALPPEQLLDEALPERRFEAAQAAIEAMAPDPVALAGRLLAYTRDADIDVFDWLLAHGAQPGALLADRDTMVFSVLDRGGLGLTALQRLLARGESVGGSGGLARWLAGCLAADTTSRSCEQQALDLLERGADAFGNGPGGEPPLALAIRLGWMRLVFGLLERGVDPNSRDARGHAALHVACALGREAAVRLLVRHGASPEIRTPDGQTALGLALAANRRDLTYWLNWSQWRLPGRALQDADLPAAAIPGDLEAVERLLDLGLPVDAVDAQGCTALLRAAGGGHVDLVALLLAAGADPTLMARTGASPLSAAVSMRHPEIVQRLLNAGAAVDQSMPGGVTPLMVAAALGLPDMCSRLLAAGADVALRDEQGYSALHCAALYAFGARERQRAVALLDTLLLAGAQADARSEAGHTPMLLALGARAEPGTACDEEVVLAVLDCLAGEDVSLASQDERGFGPLHLAALHGLLRVVQRLLRSGADPALRDRLNRTPNEIAILRGFVDVSAEFEPVRSNVSLARFLREPHDKP
ncbi:ankyrin repeat domain-containing protein [Alkalisalibacterium limincola]|uniref:Uncharacterized protein n=1 Tax=Alkalisalibacterium limincola TaxID=2699169 RepID=A0A5C8KH07_9GAMM|nr:ankyrin repeat domain-containing protein [Alkalisalibacterium limincola]TXK59710.1 hypothetical protein FU658_13075 [Alkalisalibacterium limincola]